MGFVRPRQNSGLIEQSDVYVASWLFPWLSVKLTIKSLEMSEVKLTCTQ